MVAVVGVAATGLALLALAKPAEGAPTPTPVFVPTYGFDVLIEPTTGGNYRAISNSGVIIAGPAQSAATVINTVMQSLSATTGRTRKTNIVFRGNFVITASVTVASFVALDFTAAGITRGGIGFNMFTATGQTDIEINGGIINSAPKEPQAYDTNEFKFIECKNLSFDGVTINKAAEDGMKIWDCSNVKITRCSFIDNHRHAIDINGGTLAHNIVISDNYVNGIGVFDGITIYVWGGHTISVTGNTVENIHGTAVSTAAIQVEDIGGSGLGNPPYPFTNTSNISVTGNAIYDCKYGIGIASSARPVSVTGNSIRKCQRSIFFQNTNNSTFSGNELDNSEMDIATPCYGIYLYGISNSVISSNVFRGNKVSSYGIFHNNTGTFTANTITGNTFISNMVGIHRVGNYNEFSNNVFRLTNTNSILIETGNQNNSFYNNEFINGGQEIDATYFDIDVRGSSTNYMYGLEFDNNKSYNDAPVNRILSHINFAVPSFTNKIDIGGLRCSGQRGAIINGIPTFEFRVHDSPSINPVGALATPFENLGLTVGLGGTTAIPAGQAYVYRVEGVDVFISSSGGTGVNITLMDPDNTVLATGLTSLMAQYLPVGYKIKFGNYSTPPTVVVSGN